MKNRPTRSCLWLVAATALLVPQGVAAICLSGSWTAPAEFEREGTTSWSGDFRYGPDDWVVGGKLSYAPSDKFRFAGGPGICRFGSWALTLAFRADAQFWESDDERLLLSFGPQLNWFDSNGFATTVFGANATAQYVLFDEVKGYAGVSLNAARSSGGVTSSTDGFVGAFGGVMVRTEDDIGIAAGLSYSRFQFDPQVSVDVSVTIYR